MVSIRNVPEMVHRRLKSRAVLAGMSLSDFLLNEICEIAGRPTIEELRARSQQRLAIAPSAAAAEWIGTGSVKTVKFEHIFIIY
jgi:plasmid stability protein